MEYVKIFTSSKTILTYKTKCVVNHYNLLLSLISSTQIYLNSVYISPYVTIENLWHSIFHNKYGVWAQVNIITFLNRFIIVQLPGNETYITVLYVLLKIIVKFKIFLISKKSFPSKFFWHSIFTWGNTLINMFNGCSINYSYPMQSAYNAI